MAYQSARELESAFRTWLTKRPHCHAFVTVTFKQAVRNDHRSITRITREHCVSSLWILRDRVTKALLGERRYRAGHRLKFLPFVEGGDDGKRLHAHICVEAPAELTLDEFEQRFVAAAMRLDWVYREIDIRAIDPSPASVNRLIKYVLKEGVGAFVPEAACF